MLVAIALGAALGAPARYGMAQVIHVAAGSFPWATFVTNISGSFVLGLFMAFDPRTIPAHPLSAAVRRHRIPGRVHDVLDLRGGDRPAGHDGHAAIGVAYAAASLVAGFAAVWAGIWIARTIPMPHRGGTP